MPRNTVDVCVRTHLLTKILEMGCNTKIFRKILLQSRSEWLRSELTTHHPANQVENVETLQACYYYTEELSNEILQQLLSEINPNQEIVFSPNHSNDQRFDAQLMGNQQQTTTGGIQQSLPSQETVRPKIQGTKTLFDIGEQLNTPVIGKCEQKFFPFYLNKTCRYMKIFCFWYTYILHPASSK